MSTEFTLKHNCAEDLALIVDSDMATMSYFVQIIKDNSIYYQRIGISVPAHILRKLIGDMRANANTVWKSGDVYIAILNMRLRIGTVVDGWFALQIPFTDELITKLDKLMIANDLEEV